MYVRMVSIDPNDLSFAQGIAGMCQRQGAAAVEIAKFDYESRPRLPQDFLIDPEIERAFHSWNAVVARTFHDPLLQKRQHSRQRPIQAIFHVRHYKRVSFKPSASIRCLSSRLSILLPFCVKQ